MIVHQSNHKTSSHDSESFTNIILIYFLTHINSCNCNHIDRQTSNLTSIIISSIHVYNRAKPFYRQRIFYRSQFCICNGDMNQCRWCLKEERFGLTAAKSAASRNGFIDTMCMPIRFRLMPFYDVSIAPVYSTNLRWNLARHRYKHETFCEFFWSYFHCYTVHVVELLNYYTNYCTYIKFIKFTR